MIIRSKYRNKRCSDADYWGIILPSVYRILEEHDVCIVVQEND